MAYNPGQVGKNHGKIKIKRKMPYSPHSIYGIFHIFFYTFPYGDRTGQFVYNLELYRG